MKEQLTPYQIMTSILTKYSPTLEEKLKINSFFTARYLSGHPGSVFVGNFINRYYEEVPLDVQYDVAKQLLNGKIKWIQLPKKDKNDNKTITNISTFYKISIIGAIEYYNLMEEQEREYFNKIYDGQ